MPQSLHCAYGHLVFSTKGRMPLITSNIESRLYDYLGGVVRGEKGVLIEINGTANHVHLLIRESKSIADQNFVAKLKGGSSRWINENRIQDQDSDRPARAAPASPRFEWQDGYGWFSVSPGDLDVAINYVRSQKEHHKEITFEDEYRKFLKQYGIDYDERYVWD